MAGVDQIERVVRVLVEVGELGRAQRHLLPGVAGAGFDGGEDILAGTGVAQGDALEARARRTGWQGSHRRARERAAAAAAFEPGGQVSRAGELEFRRTQPQRRVARVLGAALDVLADGPRAALGVAREGGR